VSCSVNHSTFWFMMSAHFMLHPQLNKLATIQPDTIGDARDLQVNRLL
jgi:hypothetical protein